MNKGTIIRPDDYAIFIYVRPTQKSIKKILKY